MSEGLDGDLEELLAHALRFVCDEGEERHAALRAALRRSPAGGSGSRQARHARSARALTTALAAATVLGIEDDAFEHVFLHPGFARLHANSAVVHVRTGELLQGRSGRFAERLPTVWERQSRAFIDLARRYRTLDRDGLLVLQTSMAPLFLCAMAMGPALATPWSTLWSESQRIGLGDHPSLRLHLGMIGSFAGQPDPHVRILLEPEVAPALLCAGLCLVRNDRTDHLLDCIAACMSGDTPEPRRCLHPVRPESTLVRLAEYLRSCMRSPRHFYNAGLIMNLLLWTEQLRGLVGAHVTKRPEHAKRLTYETACVEQTQIIEKGRFWTIYDALTDGAARRRLAELWSRTSSDPQ